MKQKTTILVCDDDSLVHETIRYVVRSEYQMLQAFHSDEALEILRTHEVDVLILDIQMRSSEEGLDAIPLFRAHDPNLSIVMLSGVVEFSFVRRALQLGADDYIPKDFSPEELLAGIEKVIAKRRLRRRSAQLGGEVKRASESLPMIGTSPSITQIRDWIPKVQNTELNVLITGPTGSGKEVLARQLRRTLPDGSLEPFVAVDSSTIQSEIAESLLFGHVKGAFSGADSDSKGLFEEADGGIIYFDEIGNMPLNIQAKLLRVIQEKQISPLGSTRILNLDFRVIAATNENLEKKSSDGSFKFDLYQRLNGFPIELPSLKSRSSDIPDLASFFFQKHKGDRSLLNLSKECIDYLKTLEWKGNIRELENFIAYLTVMHEGDESIEINDLPDRYQPQAESLRDNNQPLSFYDQVAQFETTLLKERLEQMSGNISKLSTSLAMDRSHLYAKLKAYGLYQPKGRK